MQGSKEDPESILLLPGNCWHLQNYTASNFPGIPLPKSITTAYLNDGTTGAKEYFILSLMTNPLIMKLEIHSKVPVTR